MKVASIKKRVRPINKVAVVPPVLMDEYHQLVHSEPLRSMHRDFIGKIGAAKFLGSQAMAKDKRGKVIYIGRLRNAVTGEPIPPMPQKFVPAQVLRRKAL